MTHPGIDALLAGRALGEPDRREEALGHLARCASCRARIAERDPARLFGLLALAAPPAGALERLSVEVARSVAFARPRRSPRRAAFAALAASFAAALLLGGLLRQAPGPGPAPAGRASAAFVEAAHEDRVPLSLELSSPRSAQLVDLSIGDTQLILIFDEGLDL